MIYIYDILLNLSNKIYNFYEWEKKDNIEHIKKIPLIKIDFKTIDDMYNNKIKIQEKHLKMIYNLCEKYDFKKKKYTTLFTDGKHVIAIEFNDNGESILKSRLMLDDEEEIINNARKIEKTEIEYEIIEKDLEITFLTRKEERIKNYLLREIDLSYLKNNYEKIKYLYLEYFDEENNDIKEMYNKLRMNINKDFTNKTINLYEVLTIENIRKKV